MSKCEKPKKSAWCVIGLRIVPVLEIIIDHPVWKSFPANPDAFQDTIASQLMHDQTGIKNSWLLVGVRNNAPTCCSKINKNLFWILSPCPRTIYMKK